MKLKTTTFYCDQGKCTTKFTYPDQNEIAAYLSLTEAGWQTVRPGYTTWEHFCPEHRKDLKK